MASTCVVEFLFARPSLRPRLRLLYCFSAAVRALSDPARPADTRREGG